MKNNIIQKIAVTVFSLLLAIGALAQVNSNAPLALPMFADERDAMEWAVTKVREGWIYAYSSSAVENPATRSYDQRTFTNDFNPGVGVEWIGQQMFKLFVHRTNDGVSAYVDYRDGETSLTLFYGYGYGQPYQSGGQWKVRNPEIILRANDFLPLPVDNVSYAEMVEYDENGNPIWYYNLSPWTYYTPQGMKSRFLVPYYGMGKTRLIVHLNDGSTAVYDLTRAGGGRQVPQQKLDVAVNAAWDRFINLTNTSVVQDIINDEHYVAGKTHTIYLRLTAPTPVYFSSWFYHNGSIFDVGYANSVNIRPFGSPKTPAGYRPMVFNPASGTRSHTEFLPADYYIIRFEDYDRDWGVNPNGFVQPWPVDGGSGGSKG